MALHDFSPTVFVLHLQNESKFPTFVSCIVRESLLHFRYCNFISCETSTACLSVSLLATSLLLVNWRRSFTAIAIIPREIQLLEQKWPHCPIHFIFSGKESRTPTHFLPGRRRQGTHGYSDCGWHLGDTGKPQDGCLKVLVTWLQFKVEEGVD